MLEKAKSWFYDLDSTGEEPAFNINGRPKNKSIIGTLFTLFIYSSLTFVLFYYLQNLLSNTNPSVEKISSTETNFPSKLIDENGLFFFVSIYNLKEGSILTTEQMQDVVTIEVIPNVLEHDSEEEDDENKNNRILTEENYLTAPKMVPCISHHQNQTFYSIMKNFREELFEKSLCLSTEDPKTQRLHVKGKIGDPYYKGILIYFFPCLSEKSTKCFSPENFNDLLIIVGHTKVSIDMTKEKKPFFRSPVLKDDQYLNKLTTTNYYHEINTIDVTNDYGTFYDQVLVGRRHELSNPISGTKDRKVKLETCTSEQIKNKINRMEENCEPYLTIEINSGQKVENYIRKYGNLIDILAEFGGIKEFIVFFFTFLYIYFNETGLKITVIRSVFDQKSRYANNNRVLYSNLRISNFVSKICFCKYGKKSRQIKKSIIDSMNIVAKENSDAIGIIKQSFEFKVISEIIFEDYHRVLIPFVEVVKKLKEKDKNFNIKEYLELSLIESAKYEELEKSENPKEKKIKKMSLEKAIQKLLKTGSQNEIGKLIDQKLIDFLETKKSVLVKSKIFQKSKAEFEKDEWIGV